MNKLFFPCAPSIDSNSILLVVKGSFQGMAGLLISFKKNQRPGLAQQNKQGEIPLSPVLSGIFWRLNVATPKLAGIKN